MPNWHQNTLGQNYASTSYLCMLSLSVTQHLIYMELTKELHWNVSRQGKSFDSKPMSYVPLQCPHMMQQLQERRLWWSSTMENQQESWIRCVTSGFARKLHSYHLMFNHKAYHQHQRQQSITACVYTCKSNNGRELQMDSCHWNGDGRPTPCSWKAHAGHQLQMPDWQHQFKVHMQEVWPWIYALVWKLQWIWLHKFDADD